MVEKLQGFAEGKYEVPADPSQIAELFTERHGESAERVESLGITKRVASTGMLHQVCRLNHNSGFAILYS